MIGFLLVLLAQTSISNLNYFPSKDNLLVNVKNRSLFNTNWNSFDYNNSAMTLTYNLLESLQLGSTISKTSIKENNNYMLEFLTNYKLLSTNHISLILNLKIAPLVKFYLTDQYYLQNNTNHFLFNLGILAVKDDHQLLLSWDRFGRARDLLFSYKYKLLHKIFSFDIGPYANQLTFENNNDSILSLGIKTSSKLQILPSATIDLDIDFSIFKKVSMQENSTSIFKDMTVPVSIGITTVI